MGQETRGCGVRHSFCVQARSPRLSYEFSAHSTHSTNTGRHELRMVIGMTPTELEAELERLHSDSFGWALTCCGWDESEAEDVLQTAYLRVVSGKARFGGRSAFKTWLFGVIRRISQESYRRAKRHDQRAVRLVDNDLQVAPVDVESNLERAERSQRLLAALDGVSERQREVLHLVFYQDLSIAGAAEVMGVSLGSARTHYERGKARMRSLLTEEEESERPA